ncbi:SURP and G-patch domain-containing protein 1 isoform X1 [Drosophila tropicalis]|uniref:SURP and G-patch domain-containing protein 1 isoform X1 n=1 Tax=Drosophila tropicalis TaxID=46794 RepID=UPI0035ABE8BC
MAQRNHRIDRIAQMSKQEEIIAKKRQEILEKQRTLKLAVKVAEAQNLAAKKLKTTLSQDPDEEDHQLQPQQLGQEQQDTTCNNEEAMDAEASGEPAPGNGKETASTVASTASGNSKTLNSFTGKTGKITFGMKRQQLPQPCLDQPPSKVMNTFCNDGSFLENFKKILEKHEKPPQPPIIVPPVPQPSTEEADLQADTNTAGSPQQPQQQVELTIATSTSAAPVMPPLPNISVTSAAPNPLAFSIPVQAAPPPPPPFAFNPTLLPQGPPQMSLPAAFFHAGHLPMQLHPVTAATAPPPPPPPPQLPLALANMAPIYMLGPSAVEGLQLNAIPPPKEFDLNAIPKPINLEPMQMPQTQAESSLRLIPDHLVAAVVNPQQPPPPPPPIQDTQEYNNSDEAEDLQQQESPPTPSQVFSETCIQLPTCIENLIALVAENGEDYEDKIRMHRSELHPALWFLYDTSCEQYRSYRRQILDYKHQQSERQRERELGRQEEQKQTQKEPQHQQNDQHEHKSDSAADIYDPESAISADIDSDDEYMRGMMDRNRDNIKRRIECRNELSDEERREREESSAVAAADAADDREEEDDEEEEKEVQRQRRKRDRKSRWGEKEQMLPSGSSTSSGNFGNQNKPMLSTVTRNDPALLQYARLNYGSTQLSEDQWKQCEEHYKVNLLYQDMMRKRQEIDRLARGGKFKYEYDSDEEIDEGGTWEHKLRNAEMEATSLWANALTKQSEGKHHIGDFLPPEELKKFMEQYEAKKNNRQPDLSDYKEYKLKEDNIGFQMLQKLGWKEGQGLGQDGAGIVNPVNKAPQRDGNHGLGVSSAAQPEDCDNEYDAYRKRMMLAYRFRPNPLNNPRRAYY